MKRMLALLCGATLLLAAAGASVASAEKPDDAGPGDNNKHGLCTAFFNGQKNGHDKNGDPGPFADLINQADEPDGEDGADSGDRLESVADVYQYCQAFGIGGQPEHNGRYDCEEADGTPRTDGDGNLVCLANSGEGDTGGDHPSGKK